MTRYRIGAFGAMVEDERGEWTRAEDVLTPRDYLAAAALQGWLASYGPHDPHPADATLGVESVTLCQRIARNSYEIADAMLRERAKEAK